MTDIIEAIDGFMEDTYGNYSHTFWGFCELSNRTTQNQTQPIPAKIPTPGTHKREQIALDDKKQIVTWTRWPGTLESGTTIEDNDWGFGIEDNNVQTINLRHVIALKVELGESLIFDIFRKIPSFFSLPGYALISIDRAGATIDADHEQIYLTELGQGKYEQHRFPWNLYVINWPIQYIINPACVDGGCCDNSFLTEDGTCLITE